MFLSISELTRQCKIAIYQFSSCTVANLRVFTTYLMLRIHIKKIANVFVAIFPAATCSLRSVN